MTIRRLSGLLETLIQVLLLKVFHEKNGKQFDCSALGRQVGGWMHPN